MTKPMTRTHGLIPMRGRDPHEAHRTATPLELFYDLTFVVAFSIAGSQLAHALAEGHALDGIIGFSFAMAAMVWAWINYSWFSSAYDTNDWGMRLATLVQMIGVLIFGLGLPAMFHGVEEGHVDIRIMVVGYVVMRASQVSLWVRASKQDPERTTTLRRYAGCITTAQALWVVVAFAHLPTLAAVALGLVVFAFEFWAVYAAEGRMGTPWHAHHIAERYSLLAIISLGEVVLGTTTAIEAVVAEQGWSVEAALIGVAGVTLAFGMWWAYFSLPFAEIIDRKPEKSFGWGYSHILVYGAIAAVGAGLHVAAYFIEDKAKLGETGVMLTIAVPLGLFVVLVYAVYHYLLPGRDTSHWVLLAATLVVLAASVLLPALGASLGWSLVVLMLAPWVTVVGYETVGARKMDAHLA